MRNCSGYTYIMIGTESRTEDFILPVGRGFTQRIGLKAVFAKLLDYKITKVFRLHHINRIRFRTDRERTTVVYLHASRLSFLSGNDNDTIGSTRTVDSSSRGIFQNRKRLDVIGMNSRERVAHTLDLGVIDRLTHQKVGSRGSHTFYHLIRIDCHHRTGYVIFLHGTITNHHRFLKHHRIFMESYRHAGSGFHFNRLITDERNYKS